ncbi:MAG: hypothetical protein KGL39_19295 [Patescibacteria group bacterium]|nr:hypothetical protein [Patescibacteria group bacterium]
MTRKELRRIAYSLLGYAVVPYRRRRGPSYSVGACPDGLLSSWRWLVRDATSWQDAWEKLQRLHAERIDYREM